MSEIKIFYRENDHIHVNEDIAWAVENADKVFWIDMEQPDEKTKDFLEEKFKIDFRSEKEIVEIETSSRYIEDEGQIVANTNFSTLSTDDNFDADMVSMVIKNNTLFTIRKRTYRDFYITHNKLLTLPRLFRNGFQALTSLLETRVDYEADMVEFIAKKIDKISTEIGVDEDVDNELLMDIKELQEKSMIIRESIIDKQRIVTSFMRSDQIPAETKEKFKILIKDITSLIDYSKFNFERLEYLQDTFLGLVNIEQNKIIKIFTVVSVIFMPPTLIASIYGMNFHFMPELKWYFGYPISIGLMILSSAGTLLFFKRKKWL